jgi:hypothetical protein
MQTETEASTRKARRGKLCSGNKPARGRRLGALAMILAPALLLAAGCGGGSVATNQSSGTLSVSPGTSTIDTNCTGCNATNSSGVPVEQFTATLGGGTASVTWSVSGGDANSGAGTITSAGQYTPPSYLTADQVNVVVKATLNTTTATAVLTITPGFLQPLTPENVALGANGTVTFKGYIAESGGSDNISYGLASTATGSSGGQGTLAATHCSRSSTAFTSCTVSYTAPTPISATGATFLVASIGTISKTSSEVLLNTEGVTSNPATHEAEQATPILLGSSGGNNNDYDTSGNQIMDCCGGTLGALIQDNSGSGRQYLLSANHVLARSDQAKVGDIIIQPGLIDDNCTPYGQLGAATMPVGTLTTWLPLSSSATNADAAIAQVDANAVNSSGEILELGAKQTDGTLAAEGPGTSCTIASSQASCTPGKGETVTNTGLTVAKSGRTTGLTCASIQYVSLSVQVDYYKDCAETKPYLTKTYNNQLGIVGNQFSDAGDSGALVVDTSNAEPVGLFFAGGVDSSGQSEGVANPAPDVLNELGAQAGGGTSYTFVGTTDHGVTCLNYGASTVTAAQGRTLTIAETRRGQQALGEARMLVNPSAGILGVATGKSSDAPGRAAIIVYTDETKSVSVPAMVGGVRTLVIPTSARAVAYGSAPLTPQAAAMAPSLQAAVLNAAVSTKKQIAQSLMKQNPAFFGVGVGQSLDNPKEAALVIYVDRRMVPAELPATIDGLRTRYVVMDRLHVTRSYATPLQSRSHCMPHAAKGQADGFDWNGLQRLKLF